MLQALPVIYVHQQRPHQQQLHHTATSASDATSLHQAKQLHYLALKPCYLMYVAYQELKCYNKAVAKGY
eukprot:1148091-Pelagomonas_calceolata.AAC.5